MATGEREEIGLESKTTTLYVHHECPGVGCLGSHPFYVVKIPYFLNFIFIEDIDIKRRRNFISLSELG